MVQIRFEETMSYKGESTRDYLFKECVTLGKVLLVFIKFHSSNAANKDNNNFLYASYIDDITPIRDNCIIGC